MKAFGRQTVALTCLSSTTFLAQAYHEAPEDAFTRLNEPQRAAIARFLRESPEAAAALSETARADAHAAFGQAEAAAKEGPACDNKAQSLLGKLMGTNNNTQ